MSQRSIELLAVLTFAVAAGCSSSGGGPDDPAAGLPDVVAVGNDAGDAAGVADDAAGVAADAVAATDDATFAGADARVGSAAPDGADPTVAAGKPAETDSRQSRRERRRAREREREAETDAEDVPIEIPDAALVSHERAVAAMAADDWVEAELELEQLVVGWPDFPGPYVNLAIVYRQDGRVDDARQALDQALTLAPDHPAANNQLGMLLREAGEFAAAEVAYRTAIAADPGYALAHYNLGILLDLYLRRSADALAAYEAFQALQPEPDPEVARWIIDLERRLGAGAAAARTTGGSGR